MCRAKRTTLVDGEFRIRSGFTLGSAWVYVDAWNADAQDWSEQCRIDVDVEPGEFDHPFNFDLSGALRFAADAWDRDDEDGA